MSEPSSITLRDGGDVDLDQLAALINIVGWEHRTRDRERFARMVEGSRWLVTAWDGPLLVGCARAISDGATNAYISTVAVAPSHQRRGIGRSLVERLMAGRDGIQFVLHAEERNHAFYRHLGFADAPDMFWRRRRF